MPKQSYEMLTIKVKPGQRVAVEVLSDTGAFTGQIIEVRSTPAPSETPRAFLMEVFEHSAQTCGQGGECLPLFTTLNIPPDEREAYKRKRAVQAEIDAQDAAERDELLDKFSKGEISIDDMLEGFKALGVSVYTLDKDFNIKKT